MVYTPFLKTQDDLDLWNAYNVNNTDWLERGREFGKEWISLDHIDHQHRHIQAGDVSAFRDDMMLGNETQHGADTMHDNETQAGDGIVHGSETEHEAGMVHGADMMHGSQSEHNDHMVHGQEAHHKEEIRTRVYHINSDGQELPTVPGNQQIAPVWMHSPIAKDTEIVDFNMQSDPLIAHLMDVVVSNE